MNRLWGLALLLGVMGQTRAADPLTQARQLYNEQKYEDAARLAGMARDVPAFANPAAVVYARAQLERARLSGDASVLDDARGALKTVDVTTLDPRDRVEFYIALGESLYLDNESAFEDRFSAAAELFELALNQAEVLNAHRRDLLFEWWALSLDRQAQQGPESERAPIYQRIVARAEQEHARPTGSISATYWLAAGARGVNDLTRALGAAVAGWVQAGSLGPRGDALRTDLDRLVMQVILPERAIQLAAGADPKPALELLQAQWGRVKETWAPTATP